MGHARVGAASANRGDALTKNGLPLKRIPPQGNRHYGMIEHRRDEPAAIDPRNCRGTQRKDAVVGCSEQQTVKLGHITWKHKIQDLPSSVGQDLVAASMANSYDENPARHVSFTNNVRMRWKVVITQD